VRQRQGEAAYVIVVGHAVQLFIRAGDPGRRRRATLDAMNDDAQRPTPATRGDIRANGPGGRLAAYRARTELPLDLFALLTLWLVVVPPWDFNGDAKALALIGRIGVSAVYGIDLFIRGVLSRRPVRYWLTHPVALATVLYPPVRVVLSMRLIRSVFRRGNLHRFLLAASVLVLNGAIIVYLFERDAPNSNIHTLGESVWWSLVTVTTVGYGDYTPVTSGGRVTACLIMAIGLLTLAVVTAQVASSFVSQTGSEQQPGPEDRADPPEVTLAELDRRLARIEELLLAGAARPRPEAEAGPDDR
jgi:voltage-gated potassium channel